MDATEKADPRLREVLASASDELITAILQLEPLDKSAYAAEAERLPEKFETQREMRQALIAAQERRAAEAFGPTVEALRRLGLHVVGGDFRPTVVVTGHSRLVLRALELEAVTSAALNEAVSL